MNKKDMIEYLCGGVIGLTIFCIFEFFIRACVAFDYVFPFLPYR